MRSNLITPSRVKTFRRCARLHHFEYELGYRPVVDAEVLFFGDLMHRGLERWWNVLMRTPGAGEVALRAALEAIAGAEPFHHVRASELLRGYHYRWIDADLEPLAVEVEYRAPLTNPETDAPSRTWEIAGKLDVLARVRRSNRVAIIEHKTTAEDIGIGSAYWLRLRMDGQVSAYFDGAHALGHEADLCIYDVIAKPTLRPFKATPMADRKYTLPRYKACPVCKKKGAPPAPHRVELTTEPPTSATCEPDPEGGPRRLCTDRGGKLYANLREYDETIGEYRERVREAIATDPERYYQRGEVVRLEDEMSEHRFDLWQQARIIRESELARRAPRNPDACGMFGRTCSFFDICTGTGSLEDQGRFIRLDNVHPELALASQLPSPASPA